MRGNDPEPEPWRSGLLAGSRFLFNRDRPGSDMADQASARTHRIVRRRSTKALRTILFGASALVAATAGASAQALLFPSPFFDDGPGSPIPPRAIIYRLKDQGFSEIGRPRFDGAAYAIDATSPAGARIRLIIDARDGDLIARRRLDGPAVPGNRVVRAAPGYGWTEDDAALSRGPSRQEALIPPADIPVPARQRPFRAEANLAPSAPARLGPDDPNALGLNPDATARPAPRRAARPTAPKSQAARVEPEAPAPRIETGSSPAKPPVASAPTEFSTAPDSAANGLPKPAANQSRTADKRPSDPSPSPPPVDTGKDGATAKLAEQQAATTPEPKRKVRVIGGATVVPGAGESSETGAN